MNHWPSTAEQGNAIKTRFDSLDLLKLINGQGHPSLPLVTRTDVVPFYWVLPSFTGIYLVLLGFIGLYLVLLFFSRFYLVLLGFT